MTYIFSGTVMPERANVNLPPKIVNIKAVDFGFSGEATVSISCSQVSVKLDTIDVDIGLFTIKNYVEYLVRTMVDWYGYLSGRGYDVEISSAVDTNGQQTVFGVGVRQLEEAKNERPLSFEDILSVVSKSPYLPRALGDLRESIRSPLDTGFFCYRAVECIRQSFKKEEDGEDRKPSWERLWNDLRIDRSWIDKIEKFAIPQRHGSSSYMSGEDRVSMMQHAWKVIDRFSIYVKRDFAPLSEGEFDILKES